MKTVVIQHWLETERGWGQRPDGVSLHLTNDDLKAFCKDYWDRMPAEVPAEYSKECGAPQLIDVEDYVYEDLERSKNNGVFGYRIYTMDLNKFLNNPDNFK